MMIPDMKSRLLTRLPAAAILMAIIGLMGSALLFKTVSDLETEKINANEVKDITKKTTSFDFEGRLFRKCFKILK